MKGNDAAPGPSGSGEKKRKRQEGDPEMQFERTISFHDLFSSHEAKLALVKKYSLKHIDTILMISSFTGCHLPVISGIGDKKNYNGTNFGPHEKRSAQRGNSKEI